MGPVDIANATPVLPVVVGEINRATGTRVLVLIVAVHSGSLAFADGGAGRGGALVLAGHNVDEL